jgi:hypothetical protein
MINIIYDEYTCYEYEEGGGFNLNHNLTEQEQQ